MAPIQKTIEQLGYTANEAKVYIAAVTLGECHVSDISSKLKMPLSSVQAIVDKLQQNGLMNFYVKNRYKFWVAEGPEKLLTQLKQREEAMIAALPSLSALRKKTQGTLYKPTVKVFIGRDEIKKIFDDIVETKHPILAIIPEDAFLDLFEGTSIGEDFAQSRRDHFLRLRMLVPNTPAGKELSKDASKNLRDVRFLPERIGIETANFIYANKVAHIMFNQQQPTAVLIEDAGISATEASIFEEIWERSGSGGNDESPFAKPGLFKTLADSSPQPLLITNERIEIVYANPAWEKQFGYTFEEVQGQNPRVLQSGKTPKEVYIEMWKTLKEGRHFQTERIVDKKKNGELFTLLTTIIPIRSGNRTWYVQALDDLTERARVEE